MNTLFKHRLILDFFAEILIRKQHQWVNKNKFKKKFITRVCCYPGLHLLEFHLLRTSPVGLSGGWLPINQKRVKDSRQPCIWLVTVIFWSVIVNCFSHHIDITLVWKLSSTITVGLGQPSPHPGENLGQRNVFYILQSAGDLKPLDPICILHETPSLLTTPWRMKKHRKKSCGVDKRRWKAG